MNRLTLHAQEERGTINRHIYGHFAEHLGRCIYEGIWVGEESSIPNVHGIRTDTLEALRNLNIPNLRWPGGCFADAYHWRDGIGPRAKRPTTINMWGNALEPNEFGTHEFMALCEQLDCEPYFGGNVGSGTVQEMADWLHYLTSDYDTTLTIERRQNGREKAWSIPFWGIGNENWGCGGNMSPQQYADLYCQYHVNLKSYCDTPLKKIASGLGGYDKDGSAMALFMDSLSGRRNPVSPDGISIHYYVYMRNMLEHSATEFGEAEWFSVLWEAHNIDTAIQNHAAILDEYDPEKKIWLIVDEWGAWYPPAPGTNPEFLDQQNSMRDAVLAATTLHIFQDHCERVQMANIAQTVNVLQAMILTEGEKFLLTPTYHVFEMLQNHQDASALQMDVNCDAYSVGDKSLPVLSASASRSAGGVILLTLCNLHPTQAIQIECQCRDMTLTNVTGRILAADAITAHNTFAEPDRVQPAPFEGTMIDNDTLIIELPAASIVALNLPVH